MSFASLPHGQIDEIFSCLGPDFFHLRLSSLLTREKSNGMDLALEILRWHCVNTALLDDRLPGLQRLGLVPLRCSKCDLRVKTRQMYRYRATAPDGHQEGLLYLCCYCLSHEVRFFLTGAPGLISFGGGDRKDKEVLLTHILTRTHKARGFHYHVLRGFLADCFRSM